MAATRSTLLRLRTDMDSALVPSESAQPTSALDVVREARRSVLFTHGPCCAASAPLVEAWARRIAETRPMPIAARRFLLQELAAFFGTANR